MQINSDNSKVNANALERIEELESALREIASYGNKTQGWGQVMARIAKKALGEVLPE
jgi:hypothetical protein